MVVTQQFFAIMEQYEVLVVLELEQLSFMVLQRPEF